MISKEMSVKPIGLTYEKCFYQNSNGNKKNSLRFSEAAWCQTNGNGYYWLGKNSKYFLDCKNEDGNAYVINIKWMFGKAGIRLTQKNRELLEANLPEYFKIEFDDEWKTYFISWDDFYKWVAVL